MIRLLTLPFRLALRALALVVFAFVIVAAWSALPGHAMDTVRADLMAPTAKALRALADWLDHASVAPRDAESVRARDPAETGAGR